MERAEWLKKWRDMAEEVYDHMAPVYWVKFGRGMDPMHRQFMQKFLGRLEAQSTILDAACGAGRYDGMLLESGHSVLGIDQSDKMLGRAQEHFPQERFPGLQYTKMSLQEMDFQAKFDGVICMDAMEHVCPEDWPGIVDRFHTALKPGGVLYVTVDAQKLPGDAESYERAKVMGLPVVFGEIVDELDEVYRLAMALEPLEAASIGDRLDLCVYHYHPPMEQVREWYKRAGLSIEEEGKGEAYVHVLARKKRNL
jgi:2-polyprenyl-3-methyl-5-hydroxy-6-metoxy-1,4-benzoquinol methylase